MYPLKMISKFIDLYICVISVSIKTANMSITPRKFPCAPFQSSPSPTAIGKHDRISVSTGQHCLMLDILEMQPYGMYCFVYASFIKINVF